MTATEARGHRPGILRRTSTLVWLALYVATLAAVIAGMFQLRSTTLRTLATPEARADWQAWREAPPNQRDDLPVRRRPPSSAEPPALVLMRDYFGVMLTAAIVFGSLLFAAIAIAARGAFGRTRALPGLRASAPSPLVGEGGEAEAQQRGRAG